MGDGDGTPGLILGTWVPAFDKPLPGRAYRFGARGDRLRTFGVPGAGRDARFGSVVATVKEADGDAATAVLVGAPRAAMGEVFNAGRVYRFLLP